VDPSYEDYFRDRLEQLQAESIDLSSRLTRWSDPSPYDASVTSALQTPNLRDRLRPDAQLLLQLAFTELVARPISAVRGQDADIQPKAAELPPEAATKEHTGGQEAIPLPEAIRRDISTITFQAVDMRAGFDPVSAHDIVNATGRTWRRLRTAQWDLWD